MTTMTAAITRAAVTAAGLLAVVTVVLVAAYRVDPAGLGLAGLAIASLSVPLVGAAAARAQQPQPGRAGCSCSPGSASRSRWPLTCTRTRLDRGADLPGVAWAGGWTLGPGRPRWPWCRSSACCCSPPGGRPRGGWRVLSGAGIVVLAAQLLNGLLAPHLLDFPDRGNPTGLSGAAGSAADALGATIVLVPVLATAGAWSLHLRWRRAARAS